MITTELKKEYPFDSHFFNIDDLNLHYIDEGQGDPIIMVHGNPTWSFYYRNLIKAFKNNYRIIVPDHIGCGFSSKPQDYNYTLENHVSNLEKLVLKLDLKNITLIVHDWGGAIGMGLATRHPERIKKAVVMNTAAFRSIEIPARINILRNDFGEWLVRHFNAFAGPATFMAVEKPMTNLVKKGFLLPYNNFESRIATAKFVRDIPMNDSHPSYKTLEGIETKLSKLNIPVLLIWGEKDFCFTMNFHKKWKEFFPKAKSITYKDAGHYVIEDKKDEVIGEIKKFLEE